MCRSLRGKLEVEDPMAVHAGRAGEIWQRHMPSEVVRIPYLYLCRKQCSASQCPPSVDESLPFNIHWHPRTVYPRRDSLLLHDTFDTRPEIVPPAAMLNHTTGSFRPGIWGQIQQSPVR